MGIIHVLDPHLSNMIAAGEVVDRPVNIVKECVENSLDAGATSIDIEVFEGGIEGIIITDDGCGMDEEDAVLAFSRHATSKLTSEDDLFNIQTMGFRGEALASIAAVAKVDLQTNNMGKGTHIRFEYGQMTAKESWNCPRGTRIEVRGLFVQTPARFKYLKKAAYEFTIISETVYKLAIAHPNIRFRLMHDGRLIFQTSGKGNAKEILYQMYGRDVAAAAVPFHGESDDFVIEGFACQPKVSRASKKYIYITVNERLVRSYPITNAILEGYHEYLPKERYPVVFINVKVDPQMVDVNVHPNKMEVRLSKEEYLSQLIINTLEALFSENLKTVEISEIKPLPKQQKMDLEYPHPVNNPASSPAKQTRTASSPASSSLSIREQSSGLNYANGRPGSQQNGLSGTQPNSLNQTGAQPAGDDPLQFASREGSPLLRDSQPGNYARTRDYIEKNDVSAYSVQRDLKQEFGGHNPIRQNSYAGTNTGINTNQAAQPVSEISENSQIRDIENSAPNQGEVLFDSQPSAASPNSEPISYPVPNPNTSKTGNRFFEDLKVIGQLRESYILCEGPEGLVIIDQHAAQERYHFEELVKIFEKPVELVQPRLVPLRISVSPDIYGRVDDINASTDYYGLHFEAFSDNSWILRQEPLWFQDVDQQAFLEDLIALFKSTGKVDLTNLRRHVIATAACHSSIRFNRKLNMPEMQQVIKDLMKCRQPFHCPHGRPTVITLSDSQLRKEFERG